MSQCFFTFKTSFEEMRSELVSAIFSSISKVTTLCSVETSLMDVLNKPEAFMHALLSYRECGKEQ